MENFEAFSRKHRIGTVPDSVRTHKPSGKDVWDTLVPSMIGVPVLTGLYYAGGVPAFAMGLAGAVGLALLDVKRTYSGWALHPMPEQPEIKDEEIRHLLKEEGKSWAEGIQDALNAYSILAKVVARDTSSTTVDVYELEVTKGFDIKKLEKLGDNFSRDLGLPRGVKISVENNIGNGRAALLLPKNKREFIALKSVIDDDVMDKFTLPIMVGKDLFGKTFAFDLVEAKHTLVGGQTRGGKTAQIANMILSLAYHCSPSMLEMTLIDPKIVELSMFDGLPHIDSLKKEAIVDMEEGLTILKQLSAKMYARYALMKEKGVRNIESYNRISDEKMKYHVVVIDEIAELVENIEEIDDEDSDYEDGDKVKKVKLGTKFDYYLTKFSRVGMAAGIVLIVGTQRLDAKTFKGQFRENIISVIGMKVKKQYSSEMLIEESGCENLLGKGDCYVLLTGDQHPSRVQAAFIDETGIEAMIKEINQKWSSSTI